MCQLFETIKVVDSILFNIDYHNERVNQTRKKLFNESEIWDLRNMIDIPDLNQGETYKCKVIYDRRLLSVQFNPYSRKNLQRLKLIESNTIDYSLKYFDRDALESLKLWHPEVDDVIIVQKNQITDCTYANLIFYDGSNWFTPAQPLLKGTKRQKYIDEKIVVERNIQVEDLKDFSKCRIINAMIDFEDCPDIPIENIIL